MASDTEGGQRPMLASQRKDTPSEATRTAGKTGYFPLGYKEGFSQWVYRLSCTASCFHG